MFRAHSGFDDVARSRRPRQFTKELAERLWRGILKRKGLPLDTPYVIKSDNDEYLKSSRSEFYCDYLWRCIEYNKPKTRTSTSESSSGSKHIRFLYSSDDDDDNDDAVDDGNINHFNKFMKKKKKMKKKDMMKNNASTAAQED